MPTDLNSYNSSTQTKITNEFIKRSGGTNGTKNNLNRARSFLNANPDKVKEIVKTLGIGDELSKDSKDDQDGNRKLGVIEKIMDNL